MTKSVRAFVGLTGLLRLSAIRTALAVDDPDFLEAFDVEMAAIGQTCAGHGRLEDPVVLVEPTKMRIVVACPWCSSPGVLAAWEAQAPRES